MASFLSIALYLPIALVLRGIIIVNGFRVSLSKDNSRRELKALARDRNRSDEIAYRMLLCVPLLPIINFEPTVMYYHVALAATH